MAIFIPRGRVFITKRIVFGNDVVFMRQPNQNQRF